MMDKVTDETKNDHCRIGSLEKQVMSGTQGEVDHCRIGSLESSVVQICRRLSDHCRIGSLEKIAHPPS